MIIKFLFLISILNLLINIINGDLTKCPNEPIYYLEDAKCDSDTYFLTNPSLLIENWFDYTNISCDPIPTNSYFETNYGILQMELSINTTYTCTLINPICKKNQEFSITTSQGPSLIITQTKCKNSYATIDFNSNGTSMANYYFEINGITQTLPYEYYVSDNLGYSSSSFQIKRLADSSLYCKRSFFLNEIDTNYPEIYVTHSTCYSDKGRIVVIDDNGDYDSITLKNSEGVVIPPTSGINNFENLISDTYGVELTSSKCGKQLFMVFVQNTLPAYSLQLVDDSCPMQPKYQIVMDGGYMFTVYTYFGQNLGNGTFTVSTGNNDLILAVENCYSTTIPMKELYSIPPIQYTISDTGDFCDNTHTVTLEFNSTVLQDIQVTSKSSNKPTSTPVQVPIGPNNNFDIVNDYQNLIYSVSSSCYSESINIIPPSRKPHYVKSKPKTNYCNDLVDITITNYIDFTTLYLFSNPVSRQGQFIYPDKNGVFKQVPNQPYEIHYIYRGCYETYKVLQIDSNKEASVTYNYQITGDIDCSNSNGYVEYQIYDKFTNEFIMNSSQYFDIYSIPTTFTINLDNLNCYALFEFDYQITQPEVTFETVTKPVCKYSDSGGQISINSTKTIYSVDIENFGTFSAQPTYPIGGGTTTITIYFSGTCKTQQLTYNADILFPDFKLGYDVIPVSSCDSFGGISFPDYSTYSEILVDNQQIQNGNTGLSLDSDYHYVSFSTQLGDSDQICTGKETVYVSTSITDVSIPYRIVQKPLCQDDISGTIVVDSITDSNQNKYPINSVDGNDAEFKTGLSYGSYDILVKSGNCSFKLPITMDYINVTITPILDDYYVDECTGHSRYKMLFSDSWAAETSFADEVMDPVTKYYAYVNSYSFDYYFSIYYGPTGQCSQSILINSTIPTKPTIKYSVMLNGDESCGNSFTTINIQVEDFKNYIYLKYNDLYIDPDGIFSNVRPGYNITGQLFNTSCEVYTTVTLDPSIISINKSITNETCYESVNGEIEINESDQSYYYIVQNEDNQDYPLSYPIKSSQDLLSYQLLGSHNIKIMKISKNQQSCISYDSFKMEGIEPELITTANDQCSDTELGSIEIKTIPSGLNGSFELGDPNTPTSSPTMPPLVNGDDLIISEISIPSNNNFTDVASNITSGNYSIIYKITTDYCKRQYNSYVNIAIGSTIDFSTSSSCESISFVPSNSNSIYSYKLFNSNNEFISETFNQTGKYNYNVGQSGVFILQVQSGTCLKNHTVQIEKCDNKNNLGLKIGLPIALVGLAAIIALGIFLYKKKRQSIKVNSVDPIQHELETVKVFSGNKLQELDKF